MSRFDYLIERPSRSQSLRPVPMRRSSVTAEIVASEWRTAPLGQLGQALWLDVERYLEFVAIARSDTGAVSVRGRGPREPGRDPSPA